VCRGYAAIPAAHRATAGAPRFDSFCDSLVGAWLQAGDRKSFEVEEVMRSCGGAVQVRLCKCLRVMPASEHVQCLTCRNV